MWTQINFKQWLLDDNYFRTCLFGHDLQLTCFAKCLLCLEKWFKTCSIWAIPILKWNGMHVERVSKKLLHYVSRNNIVTYVAEAKTYSFEEQKCEYIMTALLWAPAVYTHRSKCRNASRAASNTVIYPRSCRRKMCGLLRLSITVQKCYFTW